MRRTAGQHGIVGQMESGRKAVRRRRRRAGGGTASRRRRGVAIALPVVASAATVGLIVGVAALGASSPGRTATATAAGKVMRERISVGQGDGSVTMASGGAGTALAAGSLKGKVIVIDPGHNGLNYKYPSKINRKVPAGPSTKACDTTGTATASGYAEHAYTFDVAKRLAALLRAKGATVRLTRPDDKGVGPCINERAAIGNRAKADAVVSIHADGAPSGRRGFHVILPGLVKGYTDKIVAPSRLLGRDIRDAFKKGTGQPYADYIGKNGIDVRKDLGGLNLSTRPKVFIECGNMRNKTDAARLKSGAWRQRAAQALVAGLTAYLAR